MKLTKKPPKFYEISWLDIVSHSEWTTVDEKIRPVLSVTRGFLVKTGKFEKLPYSVFAGTICEDGSFGEVIVIPDGCISKKTKLG